MQAFVNITEYQLIPYKVQLKTPYTRLKAPNGLKAPWTTASSSIDFRQGILVKLIINDSLYGIGECAPLTEIGTESLFQAQQFLEHELPSFLKKPLSLDSLSELNHLPACQFALETALLSLRAAQNNTNIARLLNPGYARKIKVNTMLGSLDSDSISQAKEAESQGYSCLKIKLGQDDIETEAKILSQLLQHISSYTIIRLDANKSWTLEQTEWLLNHLLEYKSRVDSIEEPLKSYAAENYQYLQSKTSIALALDESFIENNNLENFPVRRLVLKPMAQGGIINTWRLAKRAQEYKIETIITSSIETGYGLWPVTFLCAAINNDQFHGLGTAAWLEDTLIEPPEINHGIITL